MTKVDFYTGSEDKLRTACQLSHKAMQNGLRVLLHAPDAASIAALDELLWNYPATAFIPHCKAGDEGADEMPVVLSHDMQAPPHCDLLVSLHTGSLPFFSRYERVIEIVGQDEADVKLGRERFGFYRDRGYEMRHFDLRKKAD